MNELFQRYERDVPFLRAEAGEDGVSLEDICLEIARHPLQIRERLMREGEQPAEA